MTAKGGEHKSVGFRLAYVSEEAGGGHGYRHVYFRGAKKWLDATEQVGLMMPIPFWILAARLDDRRPPIPPITRGVQQAVPNGTNDQSVCLFAIHGGFISVEWLMSAMGRKLPVRFRPFSDIRQRPLECGRASRWPTSTSIIRPP